MALDLRRPKNSRCRNWLEGVLLDLEQKHVLEVTLEWRPPHYHLALFPAPYMRYVARLEADTPTRSYRVARGDNLWDIARRHGVSVASLKQVNNLRNNRILPGQILRIPSSRSVSTAR
jgi:LysM repeat protein